MKRRCRTAHISQEVCGNVLRLHIDTVWQFRTGRKWQLPLAAKPAERRVRSAAQTSLNIHRVTANGLGRDQDTQRDILFCTLTKYHKNKNAFQEDTWLVCTLKSPVTQTALPPYSMWCKALFPPKMFGSDMTILPAAR